MSNSVPASTFDTFNELGKCLGGISKALEEIDNLNIPASALLN